MARDSMRFLTPPDAWPDDRRKSACKAALRRARAEIRAGKRALGKSDCGVADLHRISAAGLLAASRALCGPCDTEKASGVVDEAFDLARGVTACGRG